MTKLGIDIAQMATCLASLLQALELPVYHTALLVVCGPCFVNEVSKGVVAKAVPAAARLQRMLHV